MPESNQPQHRSSHPPVRHHFADHSRHWRDFCYVYPVVSRRASGLSIGVNLTPDATCNFDCVYCQIDRTGRKQAMAPETSPVNLSALEAELHAVCDQAVTGALFEEMPFQGLPQHLRVFRDIAFSGDAEPTGSPIFHEAVEVATRVWKQHCPPEVKIVLITNASLFDRPRVQEAMNLLDVHNGEIWAKLDAGTAERFRAINRSSIAFERIVENIRSAAQVRPIVIQSMWLRLHGEPPSTHEVRAFIDRLAAVLASGGRLKLVQVYTVARDTAERYVEPLEKASLEGIAGQIREALQVPVAVFGG